MFVSGRIKMNVFLFECWIGKSIMCLGTWPGLPFGLSVRIQCDCVE